jgi:hypothetical protein
MGGLLGSGKNNLTGFGKPCCVLQGLEDVFPFKVWIINEEFFYAFTCAYLGYQASHGNSHAANTRLAAHNSGVQGYAVKLFHSLIIQYIGQKGKKLGGQCD